MDVTIYLILVHVIPNLVDLAEERGSNELTLIWCHLYAAHCTCSLRGQWDEEWAGDVGI